MARIKKKCRVCGKEYEACMTRRPVGVFFWQEVACSKECGNEYLRRVTEARAAQHSGENKNTEDKK